MIVLDTNILSEILRPMPHETVMAWMADRPRASLFTTTVTRAEMLYGVKILPDGQRKAALQDAVIQIFDADLTGQVLGFDSDAADIYAGIAASRKSIGSPISQFDAMIAAITLSRGARLATRNVRDFAGCGVELINPWDE